MVAWVKNSTAECRSAHRGMDREFIRHVVVHHCSLAKAVPGQNPDPIPDAEMTAAKMARVFRNRALGTGGLMPYHLLVLPDGTVDQGVGLNYRGSHAMGVNWCSVAVAVVGEGQATVEQLAVLPQLVAALVTWMRGNVSMVIGHAEVPGGSADQNKKCPAPTVDMDWLRASVGPLLPDDLSQWPMSHADMRLRKAGFVIDG